jgi:hypothetical protein
VSYALAFAPEARVAWAQLDVWLQELVLDELDRLAFEPPQLTRLTRLPGFVREVVQERGESKHYVFLVLDRNDVTRELTVQQMGYIRIPQP